MVMMFVGGVVLLFDGILVISGWEFFVPARTLIAVKLFKLE